MTSFLNPSDIINKLRKGDANIEVAIIAKDVESLKQQLSDIDYKTIKNTQYERMGLELPYSWEEIYNESEAIRVQIREKEDEINNLLKLTEVK
jgi:hypothetical protein